MGSKMYVGGLPYSTTDAELSAMFVPYGAVESAKIITDKTTGQSRGFGFVEMNSASEAQSAITALNSTEMEGRTLIVDLAKPQVSRTTSYGDRGRREY
jgi:RNA recognition motif-containing protein